MNKDIVIILILGLLALNFGIDYVQFELLEAQHEINRLVLKILQQVYDTPEHTVYDGAVELV